jgi:Fur family transcriptional regulator, ferric uptake regulator
VLPEHEHGHLYCRACGGCWELEQVEAGRIVEELDRGQGFAVDLSHVTIVGRCRTCREAG